MNDKKKKKPYVKTDFTSIVNMPDEVFPTPEFDDFMEYRADAWELSREYVSVNRVYNKKTGKVKEVKYKQKAAAQRYLQNKLNDDNLDILTATHHELYFFSTDGNYDS